MVLKNHSLMISYKSIRLGLNVITNAVMTATDLSISYILLKLNLTIIAQTGVIFLGPPPILSMSNSYCTGILPATYYLTYNFNS